METLRQQKVSALLKRELGWFFQKNARTICLGSMVSITVLRISRDLSVAKVYLSIFAAKDKNEVFKHINDNQYLIKKELSASIGKNLRKLPEFHFFIDDSFEYAQEIDELLK